MKNVSREISTKYSHGKPYTSWKFKTGRNLSGGHLSGYLLRLRERRSVKTGGARGVLGYAVSFDPISGKRLD